jgi:hypothetical protein
MYRSRRPDPTNQESDMIRSKLSHFNFLQLKVLHDENITASVVGGNRGTETDQPALEGRHVDGTVADGDGERVPGGPLVHVPVLLHPGRRRGRIDPAAVHRRSAIADRLNRCSQGLTNEAMTIDHRQNCSRALLDIHTLSCSPPTQVQKAAEKLYNTTLNLI